MSGVETGFHPGELAVQRRAGVRRDAVRLSAMVDRGELRAGFRAFLSGATFAALTARDRDGTLWTSPLVGPPGFLEVASPTRLVIDTSVHVADPLHGMAGGQPVGLIVIDFATRRRLRINGVLGATPEGGLAIEVAQAYGNCPQYIHPRRPSSPVDGADDTVLVSRGTALQPEDVAQIEASDTFFLGTTHPEFGNDASHRGGPAGFVRADANALWWPDFPGNNMFNSFGNLEVDPTAALLFIDFDSGRTVQVSGSATVLWVEDQRAVKFVVRDVVVSSSESLRFG